MASNYQHFLSKFPKIKAPITLTEEDARVYSAENQPLPHKLISEYILPYDEDFDDLTEYVPCIRLTEPKKFDAVVYWKASLMNYQYILMTFEKNGKPIMKKAVAGTFSNGKRIMRSVARIDKDMSVYIMTGPTDKEDELYEASNSTTIELELLPDGKIIELE